MNVWPPEELVKTLVAIGFPILRAPLVALDIYASLFNKFSINEVITLGEFGNIFGFSILLLIAGSVVIGFFYNNYTEEYGDKTPKTDELVGYLLGAVPCIYIALTFVIYILLKLLYKY